MSLDLRNFVQVNINYNKPVSLSSIEKGIVTLIVSNSYYADDQYATKEPDLGYDGIFYSLNEYLVVKEAKEIANNDLDKYVQAFFANQGKALRIVGGKSNSESNIEFLVRILKKLEYKYVIVVSDVSEPELRAAASQAATTQTQLNPITNQSSVSTFEGINEKMFVGSTKDVSGNLFDDAGSLTVDDWVDGKFYTLNNSTGQYEVLTGGSAPANWPEVGVTYYVVASKNLSNYIVKVGEKAIEMLAAAYLSQVNTSDPNSINDYAFTIENVTQYFPNSLIEDNDVGVRLTNNHLNFDTYLVNETRNYPGDNIVGDDMVNYYVRILITQDLTETIMNLLASKVRFNQVGVNRLSNAISQQMNVYIDNGYLNTDYIWTKEDLYYTFNGEKYLVCARNTPLVKGYKCAILPLTSLTEAQREAHVLPPVYVLLADQTGIRMVVIRGDVY